MFLNRSLKQDPGLTDFGVNYYGFLESNEYKNWIKSIEGQMLTSDTYDSPYFGFQPSGAYREMDRVYEAYRQRFVGLDDITVSDETYRRELAQREASKGCPPKYPDYSDTFNSCIGYTDRGIIVGPKPTSPGISPLLILAAAAAFFFAG